jgi:hypothetical protein
MGGSGGKVVVVERDGNPYTHAGGRVSQNNMEAHTYQHQERSSSCCFRPNSKASAYTCGGNAGSDKELIACPSAYWLCGTYVSCRAQCFQTRGLRLTASKNNRAIVKSMFCFGSSSS